MNFIYILLIILILVAFRHKQLAITPSVCQQHLTFSVECRQKQIFLRNFTLLQVVIIFIKRGFNILEGIEYFMWKKCTGIIKIVRMRNMF